MAKVGFEIPVSNYDTTIVTGFTDYCLYKQNGEIIAVVESKRTSRVVRLYSIVDFLKHILKIESLPSYEAIVRKAFDAFILEHNYNADQSRFLSAVRNFFMNNRKLEPADLYEPPFTNFGVNAVEKLFIEEQVNELVELTKKLVA